MSYYSSDDDDDFLKKLNLKNESAVGGGLVEIMFSWSLSDVFNRNLLKDQVSKIPKTFTSLKHYLDSYTKPMIEEVHADLRSSLEIYSQTTAHAEITSIEEIPASHLYYTITVKKPEVAASSNIKQASYQPLDADIFVLTRTKPRHASDLSRNGKSYTLGFVVRSSDYDQKLPADQHVVKFSSSLEINSHRESYFIAFLLNMTTFMRIYKSLDPQLAKERNMCIINQILSCSSAKNVSSSFASLNKKFYNACISDNLQRFNLNDSQKNAILDCLSMRQSMEPIKLIWGPPGTGKTKTISTLLLALLQLGCRTLVCAPTNTAVVEVASRLYKLVKDEQNHPTSRTRHLKIFKGSL